MHRSYWPQIRFRLLAGGNIMKAQRLHLPSPHVGGLAGRPLSDLMSIPAASLLQG